MKTDTIRLFEARAVLLASLLAFLAAAGLPFWRPETLPVRVVVCERAEPAAALGEFQTDRDALRAAEIRELNAVAADSTASEEIRSMARRRVLDLMEWMEEEAAIEAVLAARGYEPVLVTVHSDSANVLVASERLDQADAAVMLELVSRETGIAGGNIKIIPIN